MFQSKFYKDLRKKITLVAIVGTLLLGGVDFFGVSYFWPTVASFFKEDKNPPIRTNKTKHIKTKHILRISNFEQFLAFQLKRTKDFGDITKAIIQWMPKPPRQKNAYLARIRMTIKFVKNKADSIKKEIRELNDIIKKFHQKLIYAKKNNKKITYLTEVYSLSQAQEEITNFQRKSKRMMKKTKIYFRILNQLREKKQYLLNEEQ